MHGFVRLSALAICACALFLSAAMPAAAASNAVYIGSKGSATLTKLSPVVVSMSVPAGVWWATATATVDGSAGSVAGDGSTVCFLARDGDPRDQASWTLNSAASGDAVESLYLTAVIPTGDTWSLELHCVTTSNASVSLTDIRLSAARGSGDGTQKPVFASSSNDGVVVSGDGLYHQIAGTPVTKGKWWIVGKTGLSSSAAAAGDVTCRIRVTNADQDETSQSISASGAGSQGEVVVQTTHTFAAAGFATFECKSSQTFTTSQSKIIGIKGGKLVRKPLGGTSTSSGTSTPTIYTAYTYGSKSIANGGTLASVASMKVPAGKWLVQAKAKLTDGTNVPVHCRLAAGSTSSDALSRGAQTGGLTGLYLQTMGKSASQITIKLLCAAQGSASLSFIRLTAISASAVTTVSL